MVSPIFPISLDGDEMNNMRLSQLEGAVGASPIGGNLNLAENPFEAIFSKAVSALDGVSATEFRANDLIDKYIKGQADLQEVMVATSKMNIMIQLAVTTISSAVTSFQTLTQMQI